MPPIEHLRDAFLYVVLPPALLAAVLFALPALIGWRAKYRDVLTQIAAALAIGAGLALGLALNDRELVTKLPEAEAWKWLPLVTLAALVMGAVGHLPWISPGAGWALRGAIAANAGWLLTPAELRDEHIWAPIALGTVVLAEWAVLDGFAGKGRVPLLATVPAVVASVILIYGGWLRGNQMALILAGSLAGVGITAVALRASASAASAGAAVILPSLLLTGWYNNTDNDEPVPLACFLLVALAPLALAPSLLPVWQRHQRTGLWAVQLLLLLLPLAIALWLVSQLGPLEYD